MLRTAIFFNLAWVLSFCIAVPQSTLKNVSPGALQIPRDVPENGAIIAGVMNSMWTIDEQDIAYLVVINDYKNKQLVRQSACVRNHLRTNIKARVFVSLRFLIAENFFFDVVISLIVLLVFANNKTPCIDLTGYTFIEGEFTFDSFSRIEAYLANIFENADYFMQSWTISYPYPSTTTTTFEPELRGAM